MLPASRLDFSRALLKAMNEAAARVRETFAAAHPGMRVPEIGFTGAAAIYVENDRTLKWDVALNLVTSLLGVVLLFAILYRSFGITWKVVALTTYTIWLTLGVAALWRSRISVLGIAFTAVPVGLVTDYAILVVNRFRQAHRASDRRNRAIEEASSGSASIRRAERLSRVPAINGAGVLRRGLHAVARAQRIRNSRRPSSALHRAAPQCSCSARIAEQNAMRAGMLGSVKEQQHRNLHESSRMNSNTNWILNCARRTGQSSSL